MFPWGRLHRLQAGEGGAKAEEESQVPKGQAGACRNSRPPCPPPARDLSPLPYCPSYVSETQRALLIRESPCLWREIGRSEKEAYLVGTLSASLRYGSPGLPNKPRIRKLQSWRGPPGFRFLFPDVTGPPEGWLMRPPNQISSSSSSSSNKAVLSRVQDRGAHERHVLTIPPRTHPRPCATVKWNLSNPCPGEPVRLSTAYEHLSTFPAGSSLTVDGGL